MSTQKSNVSRRQFLVKASTSAAAVILAACAPQPAGDPASSKVDDAPNALPTKTQKTLKLWSMRSPEQLKLVEKVVDEYQETTGNKVALESVPWDGVYDKFVNAVREGQGPDVADFLAGPWCISWAQAGLLAPAPEGFLEDFEVAELPPVWEKACKWDGKVVSLPYVASYIVFIYNKELMPKPPETQEELITMASALNEGQRQGFVFSTDYWHVHSYWTGHGAYGFKPTATGWDWNDLGWDSPEGIEAGKFIQRMANEGAVSKTVKEVRGGAVQGLLQNKLVASAYSGQWAIADYLASKIDIGVTSIPKINGNIPNPYLNLDVDSVSSNTKELDEAWNLAKAITFGIQKYMVGAGQVPIHKSAMESEEAKKSEIIQGFLKQFPEHVEVTPAGAEADTHFGPMTDAVGLIAAGEDVEKTLHDAVALIKKNIENIGK